MSTQSIQTLLQHATQTFYAGKLIEARFSFKKVLKKIPMHVEALYFIGLTYLGTRDYEKGIASIRQALTIKPDYVEAHYNMGNAMYETHRFDEAIVYYQQALAIKPDYWKASNNLGNILYLLSRLEEAITHYLHVLSIKPDFAETYIGLGAVYGKLKRYDDAVSAYRQAISLNPQLSDAHNNLGFILNTLEQFEDAVASFKKAIFLNPAYIDAYVGMAHGLIELKRFDEAISAYTKAYSIRPDPECAYELANLLQEVGQFDEAINYYRLIILAKPDFIEARNGLGIALNQRLRFDEAIAVFEEVLRLAPNNSDAFNNLGNALIDTKKYKEAIACYQQALAISPDLHEAYDGMGRAFKKLGQMQEAIACYQQILSINADSAEAYAGMASVFAEFGQIENAVAHYTIAITIRPDSARIIYNFGTFLEKLKRFEEAHQQYERAFSVNPRFIDAPWNQGLLHLLQGRFEQGWRNYELRWRLKEAVPLPDTPYPCWLGEESISGKKLIVQMEQGFGDAIQMMRYINPLVAQGTECWIQCQEPLHKLISRSFPQAHVIDTNVYPVPCDYHVALMSLPLAMKTFSESEIPHDVPYITADPKRITYWRKQIISLSQPIVGLVWRGNYTHQNDHNRSTTLSTYVPLITEHPEIQFVTLQKGLTQEEHALLQGHKNVRILDEELTDFDESAAVISSLDLLVTIDSAPAHLAGALGVRTWILLPFNGEWRWLLNRTDSPWYPTVKLFRQTGIGNWGELIAQVNSELEKLGEKHMRNAKKPLQHGFTLLELLVVMVIIGLLAGYVGPKYFAQIGKSEVKTARAQIDALGKALDQYRLDTGHYPSTEQGLAALNTAPGGEAQWAGPYLQKNVPLDPWGKAYQYKSPGEHGEYDLFSLGKDGQPGGSAEAADVVNW